MEPYDQVKLYKPITMSDCTKKCIAYKINFDDSVAGIWFYKPQRACRCVKNWGALKHANGAYRQRCIIEAKK